MKTYRTLIYFLTFILITSCQDTTVSIMDKPSSGISNLNYQGNRAPLEPSMFIKLPVGAVKPGGWLKEMMLRQADGLSGHLGEISAWLQKEDNAWLSPDGTGEWGWEEVPYWLKGFANLGYILEDQRIRDEAMVWIEATLNSQRPDGNFGPVRAWKSYILDEERSQKEKEILVQDFWANMIMLYCLRSYYEYTADKRVIELMTAYFKYQLSVPDDEFLSEHHYWQRIRGGDNLASVIWLYNITGEEFLLELAEKVHRNTAPWDSRGHSLDDIGNWEQKRDGTEWPDWYGDLIDWHNVNIAQGFREPAQYYQLSKNPADLKASYDNFNIVREHFGQVPGGMFGSDENSRPGYDDPRQGIETCGIVEQMNSNEHLLRITGDIFWADHTEEVAFNTFPAAVMPDFKSLRYITSPNMVLNDDKNHSPGIQNPGPFLMMNPFSSRCCQHNHTQGWPYFCENLWMATPDNGLAALMYSANTVKAKVADGKEVEIECQTNYPFDEKLAFRISIKEPGSFPLYFRIPGWCAGASLQVNSKGKSYKAEGGKYIRIQRKWNDGDMLSLTLPMGLSVKRWEKNHNSASINYGPLSFSLKIKEEYVRKESDETAIGDSKWQPGVDKSKWPSFEIHPGSPWNYGLVLDPEDELNSFEVIKGQWPENNFPFTQDDSPIRIIAKGSRIPEWVIDEYGLAGELQDSPVLSSEQEETIELIPMGAARLRISAFPVIGDEQSGIVWK
ncbi:MAG: beta-L-arabinofuranosidase domain-containing protein [Marinilabiliaceae bacterium]|jgi:hypothetical protein|nr:beta-L-arabinofuranosidase domain-containing protein [Marinilabiliaceae bacterium]